MNQQNIFIISGNRLINIIVQKSFCIGTSHRHPHQVIGIRNIFHALKLFFYVIHQHKGRVQKDCPFDFFFVCRGCDRRHGASLTCSHQENIFFVHIRLLLHHANHRFQIRLLGKNRHFQGGAVAPASRAPAAEVKAINHISFFGEGFCILRANLIVTAQAMRKDDRRHFLTRALRNIYHPVNLIFIPFGIKLPRLIFIFYSFGCLPAFFLKSRFFRNSFRCRGLMLPLCAAAE